MNQNTIPAESGKQCDCCGRTHRKLYCIDGYWVGQNCADDYRMYKITQNIRDYRWRGYEKQHAKVAAMVAKH